MTGARISCTVERAERRPLPRTTSTRSDDIHALVQNAVAGDERAWTLLVGRFDATIRSLARRHGLNAADCDEVAQRTWLALARHINGLCSHPAIAGWLLTTARRECLRILEGHRRELPYEDPLDGREPESAPIDETLLAAERRDALHRALDRAPAHERRLMQLFLTRPSVSYDEISAELKIPKGSIGPTRGRCVARLRGDRNLAEVVNGARPQRGHDLH